jgi:formiminotetrahydrofolate cyclodeaminase
VDLRTPRVSELLDRIATGPPPPGGGSVAALSAAMAAALVSMAARAHGELAVAAQADGISRRLVVLAEEDAAALGHALDTLAGNTGQGRQEQRDFSLGRALRRAADQPLLIAEAAEDVALVAAELADRIEGPVKADAAAAAMLAESAARVAAHLVAVNLATVDGDERLARAQDAAVGAGAAARRVGA